MLLILKLLELISNSMAQQENPQPQNVTGSEKTCDDVTQLFTTWEDAARRDKELDNRGEVQVDFETANEDGTLGILDNFNWLENNEFFL